MIWVSLGRSRPMTKRERKLEVAKRVERARERAASRAELEAAEQARKRESWDRMKTDIARKYAALA